MSDDALRRLREVCLALPEATEKASFGTVPTFRVRDKIFALFQDNHHNDGRVGLWCKAPPGLQEALVASDAERYYVPPYVGHNGWIGVRLDGDVDWKRVAEFVEDSYLLIAPKRLAALLSAD